MKQLSLAAVALLLSACATQVQQAAAPPAAAADGLSAEDRAAFFVNHARSGEIAEVKKALDAGVPVNAVDSLGQTALLAAIARNAPEEVFLLLDRGADVNQPDDAGWSPLHYAAWFGSSTVVLQALLDRGAKIDALNDRHITPLYFASVAGHESQVKLLLQRGADRGIASKTGYTPLRAARAKGLDGVVALLDPQAARDHAAAAAPAPGGAH
ncbi:MAG: ankyrin repeat domain-containing protein [Nevskia sp.]|nr:ankyrin repeat domain-containing protein [Nevskia sp.]